MLEQQNEFLVDVIQLALVSVFLISILATVIIMVWYFRALRKLVFVAKEVDPKAWADWGCPKSAWDMGFRREHLFLRAVSRRKGINAALYAHPAYQRAHRLYWATGVCTGLMFATALIAAVLNHLGYIGGDPWA